MVQIRNEIFFRNYGNNILIGYQDKSQTGKNQNITQGIFFLKDLFNLKKYHLLCDTIDIYLKNDYPLVLSLKYAMFGNLHFLITCFWNIDFLFPKNLEIKNLLLEASLPNLQLSEVVAPPNLH